MSQQKHLNKHLQDRSYIEGFSPTRADADVFDSIREIPPERFGHSRRWWRHIASFSSAERTAWPPSRDASSYRFVTRAAGIPPDDDDFDLFSPVDEEERTAAEHMLRSHQDSRANSSIERRMSTERSQVFFDVKPTSDEVDLGVLEESVRGITMPGLTWGASIRVHIAFGIFKLTIRATVVDSLVSVDDLEERIMGFDGLVQSVDIASFVKL